MRERPEHRRADRLRYVRHAARRLLPHRGQESLNHQKSIMQSFRFFPGTEFDIFFMQIDFVKIFHNKPTR